MSKIDPKHVEALQEAVNLSVLCANMYAASIDRINAYTDLVNNEGAEADVRQHLIDTYADAIRAERHALHELGAAIISSVGVVNLHLPSVELFDEDRNEEGQ